MSEAQVAYFDSEADFRRAIDTTLAAARREILIFDRDLRRFQLDVPTRIDSLRVFARQRRGNKIRIVLHDINLLLNRSPRLVSLLGSLSHCAELRRTPEHLRYLADSFLLAEGGCGVIRFHADFPRGKSIIRLPVETRPWCDRFEELWQSAATCNLTTPLGL